MNKNMTSQVIVNVDTKLKKRAMQKARAQGLPFSAVLNSVIRAFVNGHIDVGITVTDRLNAKSRKQFEKAHDDYKKGKNVSPAFNTADEAIAYLRS
jgi:antitoxin component of RelBE/YafQ-DinJ toxin-antitoxin module